MPFNDVNSSDSAEAFGASGAGYEEDSVVDTVDASSPDENVAVAQDAPVDAGAGWNPDEFQLKFRDSVHKPKTKEELINLAQRGILYDKKGQELNEKLKSFSARESELAQKEAELQELMTVNEQFNSNPEMKRRILGLLQEVQNAQGNAEHAPYGSQEASEASAEVMQLRDKIGSLEKQLGEVSNYMSSNLDREAMDSLDKDINALKERYSFENWNLPDEDGNKLEDTILQYMHKHGVMDPEAAYRHLRWDAMQENTKAQTLKE
jgi:hypothetical protein